MDKFNMLLDIIQSSMKSLKSAIQGLMVMSSELDMTYYSLLNNQVPKLWQKVAYPSLKPLASWIADLNERVKVIRSWLTGGNPCSYWMSGLFYPQGFLTGVL